MDIITVTPPDGYTESKYVVLVDVSSLYRSKTEYAVTVLEVLPDGTTKEVAEAGCGPLSALMADAARVIRTGHV